MILPKKYFPINWTGSMKFSETHLIENERSIYDAIRDAISVNINSYNYGVLPPFVGQNESFDIQINQRSDQFVQITVNGLNAITAAGLRIFINPKNAKDSVMCTHSFVATGVSDKDAEQGLQQIFDIVLRVNTEERVLLGEPDPEEMPPRIPYIGTKYTLDVLQNAQASSDGVSYLIVGRIIQQGGQFLIDEGYIPPCTAIMSHPALIQYYKDFAQMLSLLQMDASKIIAKIHFRNQHSTLSNTIEVLCRDFLDHMAVIQFQYQNTVKQDPPIVMIGHFSTLANRLLIFLNCLNTVEKEELLNYFYQWIDITPGAFVQALTKCAGIIYQHQDIKQSIEPIAKFLSILNAILQRLSTLEYIGQRRDNIVITEQTQVRQSASINQTWRTID